MRNKLLIFMFLFFPTILFAETKDQIKEYSLKNNVICHNDGQAWYCDDYREFAVEENDKGEVADLIVRNGAVYQQKTTSTIKNKITDKMFIGSLKSNKYHLRDCKWAKKISPYNAVFFNTPEEALKQGYVPCQVCNPPINEE